MRGFSADVLLSQSSEDVFLIFSANKSGEYFGYARMDSDISQTEEAEAQEVEDHSLLTSRQVEFSYFPGLEISETPATEWAPKGKVIDDSARGTIFWEADLPQATPAASTYGGSNSTTDQSTAVQNSVETGSTMKFLQSKENEQAVSTDNPFKLRWYSIKRLPFYRTRGLRNPWNGNREVKVARDGTELEPGVAEKLLSLFNEDCSDLRG